MVTLDDALDLIQDAVRHALLDAHHAGAAAFQAQRLDEAQAALERARDLKALEAQLHALVQAIDRLLPAQESDDLAGHDADDSPQPVHRRAPRGLKTPESAYLRPILETLVELGGSGQVNDVLDRVYTKLKPILNEQDHTPLQSDGLTPRWRNTAQWARNTLREQGLVRNDAPRGVWVISEQGRAWLTQSPTDSTHA